MGDWIVGLFGKRVSVEEPVVADADEEGDKEGEGHEGVKDRDEIQVEKVGLIKMTGVIVWRFVSSLFP
jgi:hypothetical protein